MSEILDESLKKIVKGTGIVFVGTIIGMLLAFISRLIIIRYLSQSEYGAFSLGLALMNIFVFISTLGLQQGIPRYMGYFRGKNEKKIWSVISSSLQLSMVSSIFISFFSYFSSGFFADFFNIPELSIILKIFAIAIPFFALINIFVSIFRGFDRVDVKVYFRDILRNILTIIFFVLIVIFGLSFVSVMYAYTAAIIITAIFFAIYSIKRLFRVKEDEKSESMRKSLLFFSIPLLAQGFLIMVMSWTDTLMLGYFKTADIVGLYNAALPLSRLIPLFLTSLVFIYVPIVSQLYSKNLIEEMRRNYAVLTKWILSATLPVFLTLFLFPSTVLNFFFGYRYIQADFALQILALGFFIHTFLGPNGATLLVMGKTRLLMLTTSIGAVLNIILNITLIPPFGIVGASIASALSLGTINILNSTKLYMLSRTHPFTKNYVKPLIVSIALIYILNVTVKNLFAVKFWMLPLFFAIFLVVYCFSLFLTKSFDNEDIMILLAIEKRTGVDATPIKKILRRFV